VVADFNLQGVDYNPQTEIVDGLQQAVADDVSIRIETTNASFENSDAARAFGQQAGATMLVWGRAARVGDQEGYFFNYETLRELNIIQAPPSESLAETANYPDSFFSFARQGLDPGFVVNYTLGVLYIQDDDYESALRSYQQAENTLAIIPENERGDLELGAFYFGMGFLLNKLEQHKEALPYHDLTVAAAQEGNLASPLDAFAYGNRGIAYRNLGQFEQAIQDYNTVLELDPEDAFAFYNRGIAYADLGQFEQAIQDYNSALELDLEVAAAYWGRGIAYHQLEQYQQAIGDYNSALELDPEYAFAFYSRGGAYYNLEQYQQAIDDYNSALELDPEYAFAFYSRGLAYHQLEQYQQAIGDYNSALELDPEVAAAYWGRGLAYYNLDNYEAAIADYREYERLTGALEPFMVELIAEMEAALAEE